MKADHLCLWDMLGHVRTGSREVTVSIEGQHSHILKETTFIKVHSIRQVVTGSSGRGQQRRVLRWG